MKRLGLMLVWLSPVALIAVFAVANPLETGGNFGLIESGGLSSPLSADLDMDSNDLICDDSADDDTKLVCDTDDEISIEINGSEDFLFAVNSFTAQAGSTIWADNRGAAGPNDYWTSNDAIKINDAGTAPSCDATVRGLVWYEEGGAGVADNFQVCKKSSGDAYAYFDVLTAGGISNVVEDLSPQLGAQLDTNNFSITDATGALTFVEPGGVIHFQLDVAEPTVVIYDPDTATSDSTLILGQAGSTSGVFMSNTSGNVLSIKRPDKATWTQVQTGTRNGMDNSDNITSRFTSNGDSDFTVTDDAEIGWDNVATGVAGGHTFMTANTTAAEEFVEFDSTGADGAGIKIGHPDQVTPFNTVTCDAGHGRVMFNNDMGASGSDAIACTRVATSTYQYQSLVDTYAYMNEPEEGGNATATAALSTSWQKLTGTGPTALWTLTDAYGFTYAGDELTIDSNFDDAMTYQIDYDLSFFGTATDVITTGVTIDDLDSGTSVVAGCFASRKLGTTGDVGSMGASCQVTLTSTSIVYTVVKSNTTNAITPVYHNFRIRRL